MYTSCGNRTALSIGDVNGGPFYQCKKNKNPHASPCALLVVHLCKKIWPSAPPTTFRQNSWIPAHDETHPNVAITRYLTVDDCYHSAFGALRTNLKTIENHTNSGVVVQLRVCWYISKNGLHLLQLQHSRYVLKVVNLTWTTLKVRLQSAWFVQVA